LKSLRQLVSSVKEMILRIFRVNDGGAYFSQGFETFLRPESNSDDLHSPVNSKILSELLTPKEIEVIELVSKGLHNKEIASALGIKVRTAESHVCNILSKLRVSKRFEAVLYWTNVNKETR